MIRIYHQEEFSQLEAEQNFDPRMTAAEEASAHIVLSDGGQSRARCSVWWEGTPAHGGGVCGTIGHFAAESPSAAKELLQAACLLLRQQQCVYVLAPMHGSTYRSYRYATGGPPRPPFLMEPPTAKGRDGLLEQCGFEAVDHYYSYLEQLQKTDTAQQRARLARQGIQIRTVDMGRLEETLGEIYRLSAICFRDNAHYTDISREAFMGQYLAYRHLLVPEFILLACHGEDCIGFAFCIPDYLESATHPTTVLLKTAAVLPEYRRMGIVGTMLDTVREAAWDRGFTQAIGALVHEDNVSRHLLHQREVLRTYTLYGKKL